MTSRYCINTIVNYETVEQAMGDFSLAKKSSPDLSEVSYKKTTTMTF